MENFHVYRTNRKRSNYVMTENVIHKGKTFQLRADFELRKRIEDLAKELNQTDSKVIKDILEDFFLEQTLKEQKEDVEHFLKND